MVESEEVLQAKRLGPTVCVPLMERSLHARTRLMGYQACLLCVERIGLSGIGKKGVLVTAKCLSEESLPENRAAALELLNSILSRMNGDITRLSKICGSNLSDKARSMLEAFQQKRDGKASGTMPNDLSRQSLIPTPTTSRRLFSQGAEESTASTTNSAELRLSDQLPALQLRYAHNDANRSASTPAVTRNPGNPFAFSLKAEERPFLKETYPDPKPMDMVLNSRESSSNREPDESNGAAASLRARLLKIREKNKVSDLTTAKLEVPSHDFPGDQGVKSNVLLNEYEASEKFKNAMESFKMLLESRSPVVDGDPMLSACEKSLKIFHAALSGEPNVEVDLTEMQLQSIKEHIKDNTNAVVEQLSRYVSPSHRRFTKRNVTCLIFLQSESSDSLSNAVQNPQMQVYQFRFCSFALRR